MSLEESINKLTAAVEANTAALLGAETKAEPAKRGRRASTTESAPPAAAPAAPASAPAAAPVTPQPAVAPSAPSVTLKQWTDKFVELGELGDDGRAASIAIMESYGAARASLIPADKYAEAYARAVAEIAKRKQPAPAPSAQSLV